MVAAYRAGAFLRQVAKDYNNAKSTVQRWVAFAKGKRLDRIDFHDKKSGTHPPTSLPTNSKHESSNYEPISKTKASSDCMVPKPSAKKCSDATTMMSPRVVPSITYSSLFSKSLMLNVSFLFILAASQLSIVPCKFVPPCPRVTNDVSLSISA